MEIPFNWETSMTILNILEMVGMGGLVNPGYTILGVPVFQVSFLYWYVALGFAALTPVLLRFRRRNQPVLINPSLPAQKNLRKIAWVGYMPAVFFAGFLLALGATLSRPVVQEVHETRVVETRDIGIEVDISGSMDGKDVGNGPPDWPADKPYSRLDAARDALRYFVPKREGDRIFIGIFNDKAFMHWPLTDDIKVINTKVELINKFTAGGTNFQGPTQGEKNTGPIQAALNHWKEYGKAKTKVLVMVTDGEAPISDERMDEIVRDYKAVGAKIYVLGIGPEWTTDKPSSGLDPIKKLVAALGGKCFAAGDLKQVQAAIDEINTLEKSHVELERSATYRDVYSPFAALAAILLVLFMASIVVTREHIA